MPFIEFADGTRWSPEDLLSKVTLLGTTGNDTVQGHFGNYNEVFDLKGGTNDIVIPDGGSDTFVYRAGYGTLTIHPVAYAELGSTNSDLDTLELHGIDAANVIVSLEPGYHDWGGDDVSRDQAVDLVFRFKDQSGSVIVKRAFHDPDSSTPLVSALEQVRFDDGMVWNTTDIASRAGVYGTNVADILFSSDIGSGIIRGGGGDDRILDVTQHDVIYWAKGDGNDRISRIKGPGTLVLDNVQPGEASFQRDGWNLLLTVGGETITIVDQMSPTYSYAGTAPDGTPTTAFDEYGLGKIVFADGSELSRQQLYELIPLDGTLWSNYLEGSRWADTINGLGGDDTLVSKEGNDTLKGGDGSDTLLAGNDDDLLIGGAGDDKLNGGAGSDTYQWTIGDGNDHINDKGSRYDGTDTLRLIGVTADDIQLARIETASTDSPYDALRITIKSTGEVITIDTQYLVDQLADQFLSRFDGNRDTWEDGGWGGGGGPSIMALEVPRVMSNDVGPSNRYSLTDIVRGIERIVLDDGTVIDPFSNSIERRVEGTDYDDQLEGTAADETFVGGAGSDAINVRGGYDTAVYSGAIADYLVSHNPDGSIAVAHLASGIDTDTLTGIETLKFGDVTLALSDLPALGTDGNDVITGSARSDHLYGFGGDDQFIGGAGDDIIDGGDGMDQARYSGSSTDFSVAFDENGNLTVVDRTGAEGSDVYQNVESIFFAGDKVTIQVADLPPTGTPGDDVMTGTEGPDRLYGFGGNDTMSGLGGDDVIAGGDGNDAIDGGDGNDQVQFNGTSADYQMGIQPDGSISVIDGMHNGGRDVLTNVESLYFAGDDRTITISDLPALGTSGDDVISGTSGADMLFGLGGDDVITGGGGWDLIDGGDGNDQANFSGMSDDYAISREPDGTISIWSSDGYATLREVESIYFAGDSVTIPIASLPSLGTADDDVILGTNRTENLYGNGGNDEIVGLGGDDYIEGGDGNDIFDGGTGDDFLVGGEGQDTARYAGTMATHSLTTSFGLVAITDNDPVADGDDGSDSLMQVEQAQFSDGTFSIALPIVLDLDGNGVSLVDRSRSTASFDWNGDGIADRTGWIGQGDGLLALDRNHDGRIDAANELSFTGDKSTAKSDLDGLSAFDTNGDGKLSAADAAFGDFDVWQDANGDGISNPSELRTLADVGISAINLTGSSVNQSWGWDANVVMNSGTFERSDGTVGQLADAGLNYAATVEPSSLEGVETMPRKAWWGRSPWRVAKLADQLADTFAERSDHDGRLDHVRAASQLLKQAAAFVPSSATTWTNGQIADEREDGPWPVADHRVFSTAPVVQAVA